MDTILADNYEELSKAACTFITNEIREKLPLTLCLATGSTPTRTYELLEVQQAADPHLFDQIRVIKLDEWGGLPMEDPATCEAYLQRNIVQPLNIDPYRYIAFKSDPLEPESECQRVQNALDRIGPIDLCVLGLGANGHLGFNEPDDSLHPHPHVAVLAQSTLQHPMAQQTTSDIAYGLTLGMANILQARHILLLVSGEHKRDLLKRLLTGAISTHFPASFLWLHPNVTIVCDKPATVE